MIGILLVFVVVFVVVVDAAIGVVVLKIINIKLNKKTIFSIFQTLGHFTNDTKITQKIGRKTEKRLFP